MTAILGISAFYHDSAAAVVVDGRIVAAVQEERFTRRKHEHELPAQAVAYCLQEGNLKPEQLDYVGFYDKPFLKFERLLETYLAFAPAGFRSFRAVIPSCLHEKLHVPRELRKALEGRYRKRFVFTEHHQSHAASAFFPSPFDEAAILTLDGVGEWATASYGIGRSNRISLSGELRFPHSLGLLYSAFTHFCGFKVNSGEHKLMGLAPYGQPKYRDVILQKLVDLKPDGSFRTDLSYFNYCQGLTMTSAKFQRLFGGPPRKPESPLSEREMDLAASIQKVTEEVMLRAARHVHEQTGMKNLCLAGGVALNCVGNGRILREGPFENVWIQPASGDSGGALGTALFIWHQLLGHPREPANSDAQQASFLGPQFSDEQIRALLDARRAKYRCFEDDADLCDYVAALIASEKTVGWMQGRAEFGPRALGNRSILGEARSPRMQSLLNEKIKFRESFRPFAPAVLRDRVSEYFDLRAGEDSPYMLLVAPVAQERRLGQGEPPKKGLDKLKVVRSQVPAVTHVDFSARVQTVDPVRHGRFYRLLRAFESKTGCPVVVNTSFNVRGEPIVSTPEEAYRCFMATNLDVLAMGRFVLLKEEQPEAGRAFGARARVSQSAVRGSPEERTVCGEVERPAPSGAGASSPVRFEGVASHAGEAVSGPPSSLVRIDSHPPPSRLRVFGGLWLVFFALCGAIAGKATGSVWPAAWLWMVAAAVPAVGWTVPGSVRLVYLAVAYASYPFSCALSHLILAGVYYLVLTPIGLLLRLLGYDPMARRPDTEARSYWRRPRRAEHIEGYFRQY